MPCANIKIIKKPKSKLHLKINSILKNQELTKLDKQTIKKNNEYIKHKNILNINNLIKPQIIINQHIENIYQNKLINSQDIIKSKEKCNYYNEFIIVNCRQCSFCKAIRQKELITKTQLELENTNQQGCFITLTYNEKNKKNTQGENKIELQKFLKRLRKNTKAKFKYISCGEYGKLFGRIHLHIIIIGWQPNDFRLIGLSKKNKKIYNSKTINKSWKLGNTTIQEVTKKTIQYITLYGTKSQKYSYGYDKINNIELYNQIKLMNQNFIQENKEIRKKWLLVKKQEFNTFSQKIGWEQFLKNKYLEKNLTEIGTQPIPNYWLTKILYNKEKFSLEQYYASLKILKQRKNDYIDYLLQEYGTTNTFIINNLETRQKLQQIIDTKNSTNAYKNIENIYKSNLKQQLDFF